MKRQIITIDEEKCTGCGDCIISCPEGALQIVDGTARLIGDLLCDGLGACIGHCPEGAITIEEREAEPYDEAKVMQNVVQEGPNVLKAHLEHLRDHNQTEYLQVALAYMKDHGIGNPLTEAKPLEVLHDPAAHTGCPGTRSVSFTRRQLAAGSEEGARASQLTHWPVQLHLLSPMAPQYRGADLLLSADCVAYAVADFHQDYLKGKSLAIACPKLDEGQQVYLEKIRSLVDDAAINTLTVMIMQVPCCTGLLGLAQKAAGEASRKVPIKCVTVGVRGEILAEEWV